ncbi:GNAT family N-acetyltransferase [Ectopseudomonas hydrolytica]|uniref:GNAT family N-acetyltransferase n=1 Tax=Ectopseudomonas hydrolytica TaxID=2493633 RepID=UPI000BC30129|nr:GNAT family N-acetyltransferase [Pseudomonas hydrolytica]ATH83232.1 GNAT family N-acetyltransferase [Pseudomonas mendocina]MBF8163525.1 N-acetyltransferase [Pseudomonas mendocina]UTH32915.1 GNAT family N-acetyltransferase [Pseudomonas hydrolytica]UZZ12088.1 GNAT family N-acetyltransferase [Pseudomonas mendocina]
MPLHTLPQLSQLPAASWDALLPTPQPFVRHAFLSALEDSGSVGGRSGWQPSHRLWYDEQGRLQAAMPTYVKQHSYGEYVFDHAWADACRRAGIAYYPKLLGAVPFSPVSGARLLGEPHAAARLLDELSAGLPGEGLSSLHVNFTTPACDALLEPRSSWLQRLGCQFHWHNRGYRDFQDFLDALSSRKRKQLRKEREQVAGQGIEFDWLQGHQLSEAQWDFVYQCYANTYHVRGQAPYLTREFFSLLAERMPEALRVVLAQQHGRPVAMALSLVGGDTFYGRYWGCLAEFDRLHFETCFYQGMQLAVSEGLARFDAGAQGEHKLIRGFEPVITRSWHLLLHPGLHAAVADFLEQERPGVLAYAEEARSYLPYRQA